MRFTCSNCGARIVRHKICIYCDGGKKIPLCPECFQKVLESDFKRSGMVDDFVETDEAKSQFIKQHETRVLFGACRIGEQVTVGPTCGKCAYSIKIDDESSYCALIQWRNWTMFLTPEHTCWFCRDPSHNGAVPRNMTFLKTIETD